MSNTGTSPTNLTFTANFHSNMSSSGSGLRGSIGLFDVVDGFNLQQAFNDGNVPGYLGEGLNPYAYESDSIFDMSGSQSFSLTASHTFYNGDRFYLYGEMSAYGSDGGSSNGLSTGSFSFDNSNLDIVGATSAVPVPAALYLYSTGLMGLFYYRRKKA